MYPDRKSAELSQLLEHGQISIRGTYERALNMILTYNILGTIHQREISMTHPQNTNNSYLQLFRIKRVMHVKLCTNVLKLSLLKQRFLSAVF